MRPIDEAKEIFRISLNNYKKLCIKENGEIRSDRQAYFYNAFFSPEKGGRTGYQRAESFMSQIEEGIASNKITTTPALITFADSYIDNLGREYKICNFIRDAILESVGFNKQHVDYLYPLYARNNMKFVSDGYYGESVPPGEEESRQAIRQFFMSTVRGFYPRELLKLIPFIPPSESYQSIHSFVHGYKSRPIKCQDMGDALISYLNGHVVEVELKSIVRK